MGLDALPDSGFDDVFVLEDGADSVAALQPDDNVGSGVDPATNIAAFSTSVTFVAMGVGSRTTRPKTPSGLTLRPGSWRRKEWSVDNAAAPDGLYATGVSASGRTEMKVYAASPLPKL